jgi:hypothetical protein
MDEKIGNINKAKALYDSEKERIALLDTAIPAKPQAEVFIRQIEGLVGKDNTLLDSFQTGKVVLVGEESAPVAQGIQTTEALPEGAGALSFSLRTSSDYPSIYNLSSDLEILRMPVKIDSFDISSQETETSKTLSLSVEGRTPYLKNIFVKETK